MFDSKMPQQFKHYVKRCSLPVISVLNRIVIRGFELGYTVDFSHKMTSVTCLISITCTTRCIFIRTY